MSSVRNSNEREGIGFILGFSENKRPRTESIRRTLSADMSSKTWLAQQQSFQLKRVASSEQIKSIREPLSPTSSCYSSSSCEEEVKDGFDIWSSMQSQKNSNSTQPNYVHPLVKRSSSSLSEKSLQICTESLGSETGFESSESQTSHNDSFLFATSEDENYQSTEEEEEEEELQTPSFAAVNYNCSINRKSPIRCFPPPLPSISRRDGPRLHMKPLRQQGRLVLQAVPVPAQKYLHAQRHDGRLLLSLITTPITEQNPNPTFTQVPQSQEIEPESDFESSEQEQEQEQQDIIEEEDEEDEEEEEEEGKTVMEMTVSQQLLNMDRSTLVINKLISKQLVNLNPWNQKLEKEQEQTKVGLVPCFNVYDYCWRKQSLQQQQQQPKICLQFLKEKEEEFKTTRCKEPRRPLWIWETVCIATS